MAFTLAGWSEWCSSYVADVRIMWSSPKNVVHVDLVFEHPTAVNKGCANAVYCCRATVNTIIQSLLQPA